MSTYYVFIIFMWIAYWFVNLCLYISKYCLVTSICRPIRTVSVDSVDKMFSSCSCNFIVTSKREWLLFCKLELQQSMEDWRSCLKVSFNYIQQVMLFWLSNLIILFKKFLCSVYNYFQPVMFSYLTLISLTFNKELLWLLKCQYFIFTILLDISTLTLDFTYFWCQKI